MTVVFRISLISISWVAIQFASGWIAHRTSLEGLKRLEKFLGILPWESTGKIYQKLFRIQSWKDRLPEAGAFFTGGVAKNHLDPKNPQALRTFYYETLRAEFSHWLPFFFSWSFFLWNSPDIAWFMPPVAMVGNLPFIVIQRYNRARVERILRFTL
ncbi:MAG: hypothetical protein GW949_08710 [Spirochaetales bacterium]|nr:hypothetical protein [Spirochaetales bacterium]